MSQTSQRHLFVIGFFRSGTSLLYSFLNLHPRIKLLYEADLLGNSLTTVSSRFGLKWWERLDFYNTCLQRHRLKLQPSWPHARSAKEAADLLYQEFGGTQPLYLGEKSPSYYNCLPALAREFPDARFIMIWRDPQAVISSILNAGEKDYFFRSRSLPLRSLIGLEQMQADTLALRAQGVPIFDLCCEDLVENPEPLLRSICDFLELPFDSGMLDLTKADCSMFPPGEHQDKARSGRVQREPKAEATSPKLLSVKVGRYLLRWKTLFRDQLKTSRYWSKAEATPPTPLEVFNDNFDCALHRLYSEQIIPVIYGLLPLPWLATYRRFRGPVLAPDQSVNLSKPLSSTTISVVTPSYKQLPWLKLCIASVADQKGVRVEHIIQDAQSGSELESWVLENSKAKLFVEADSGMYDAINRGFARATGDIVCWLNSDEQYLEGALAKVARFFDTHPDIDVLFGDALLIGNTGGLLSYRRTIFPNVSHIQLAHLNVLSCATFVRRSVLQKGYILDTRWRAIADAVWIVSLLKAGIRMDVMNEPLAVFTITDKNLGQSSLALRETERWQQETSPSLRWFKLGFVLRHRLNKLAKGAYWPRAVAARLYTLSSGNERITRSVSFLGFKWPGRI